MTSPAQSAVQNLLPVQAYFDAQDNFVTFIGQNKPFFATSNPDQSGLNITNSTINSTTIGAITPSTGVFTNIATTTGTISTTPSAATDIANKQYVDYALLGISWKAPARAATTVNITLSGAQTIDTVSVVAGDTVLVKNQTNAAENGIYTVQTGAWTYATGSTTWAQYIGAVIYIVAGGQATAAFYTTAQPGGTLGTTAMNWYNLSFSSSYTAGTGLTLTGTQFSITNTGVTAASVGSASKTLTATVNAQGQLTALADTNIAIAGSQITSGTIGSSYLSGSYTGITGVGTLTAGTWNASTIGVAYGGTGATTLTGYVKGSGTAALTASASIPTTDLSGTVTNAQLANSSITINGNSVSLGGSTTVTATASNALTIGSGLSGTSYNGSAAVTIAIDSTVATLSGTQTLTNKSISGSTNTLTNIPNSALTNSSITFGATSVSLGATVSAFNAVSIGATTASTGAFTYLSTSSTTSTTPVLGFNASNTSFASGATISGSYLQAVLQNKSGTAGASTNFAVSNDLGTDSTYYGEMGMNSSVFTASGTFADFYAINNGIYFSGHDGDVSVGSGNGYKLYLTWGTTGQSAHVINSSGAIGLSTNLGTSAATTGTSGFGTNGQVLTSAGSSAAPTWTTITPGVSITDDTTTNSTRYPLFTTVTTGNVTTEYVSSTKYQFNPSTGILTATGFAGALNGSVGATTPSTGAFTTLSASSTATFTGSTSTLAAIFTNAAEVTGIFATAATGTINYDVTTQSVLYYTTNASANWTVNFRASSGTSLNTAMTTGQSVTVAFLVTQGSTAYYNSAITIDGTSFTPKWQGGTAPTAGNASGVDVYSYTIVKTGSAAFTVFASQTQFK
jgi:hypothetical protein